MKIKDICCLASCYRKQVALTSVSISIKSWRWPLTEAANTIGVCVSDLSNKSMKKNKKQISLPVISGMQSVLWWFNLKAGHQFVLGYFVLRMSRGKKKKTGTAIGGNPRRCIKSEVPLLDLKWTRLELDEKLERRAPVCLLEVRLTDQRFQWSQICSRFSGSASSHPALKEIPELHHNHWCRLRLKLVSEAAPWRSPCALTDN